jgi:hypothetical protein
VAYHFVIHTTPAKSEPLLGACRKFTGKLHGTACRKFVGGRDGAAVPPRKQAAAGMGCSTSRAGHRTNERQARNRALQQPNRTITKSTSPQ